MYIVKRYADGRFYDPQTRKYLRREALADLLVGQEEIQVIQSRTGKDVTREVAVELGVGPRRKKGRIPSAEGLKKWLADNKKWLDESIDKRIDRMTGMLNLPSREQIVRLTAGIEELSAMIRDLQGLDLRGAEKEDPPTPPTEPAEKQDRPKPDREPSKTS